MADQVIRDAIIRISLQAGDDSNLKGAFQEIRKEAAETQKVQEGHTSAIMAATEESRKLREQTVRTTEAATQSAEATKQAGEGAFTAARGFTLLASSNQESAAEMIKTVAVAQGAFDVYKGGLETLTGLSRATGLALGTLGTVAIPAVGAALLGGVALWRRWGDTAVSQTERARRATEEFRRSLEGAQAIRDVRRAGESDVRALQGPSDALASINAQLGTVNLQAPGTLPVVSRARREVEEAQAALERARDPIDSGGFIGFVERSKAASELERAQSALETARENALSALQGDRPELQAQRGLLRERFDLIRKDFTGAIGSVQAGLQAARAARASARETIEEQDAILGRLPRRPFAGPESPRGRARAERDEARAELEESEFKVLSLQTQLNRLTTELEEATSAQIGLLESNTRRMEAVINRQQRLEQEVQEANEAAAAE